MDPDAIFIMLLYFIFLILTIGGIIGLSRKIWSLSSSTPLKVLFIGLLIIYLVIALLNFDTVGGGELWIIGIIIFPSCLISLNWSINIIRKHPFDKIRMPHKLKIIALTIIFTALIPTVLFLAANFFDWLNLMGSCC